MASSRRDEQFDAHGRSRAGLLEWADVRRVPSPRHPAKQPSLRRIAQGEQVVLEIDVQGGFPGEGASFPDAHLRFSSSRPRVEVLLEARLREPRNGRPRRRSSRPHGGGRRQELARRRPDTASALVNDDLETGRAGSSSPTLKRPSNARITIE